MATSSGDNAVDAPEQRNIAGRKLRREKSFNVTFEGDNSDDSESSVMSTWPLLDFDDILPFFGEFGRYQMGLFLMTFPFLFFMVFVYMAQMFMTLVPVHWCNIDELMHLPRDQR